MPSIFNFINAQEIGTYYEETAAVNNAIPYLGEGLFPAKKQLGLELRWIKGANGLPIVLKPSAFDAKATLRDRIGFKELITEMPFFREGMRIGEQDRQELNKAMSAANSNYIMPLINKIYDDTGNLVRGAQAQAEKMRMSLLYLGTILIDVNGVNMQYEGYGVPTAHKTTLTTTSKWSAVDTAKPVSDIEGWMDKIEGDTGIRPTRAICTRKTFGYLRDNESIKKDMNPLGATNVITTEAMIKSYFETKLNLSFAIYDKKYSLENGTAVKFFADDYFTLLPDGAMGNTFYGTTPEESDLMAGSDAQVRIVDTGVAITTIKEPHPVNVQTIVSAIMLPSFPQAERIFIAKVN